MPETFEDLSIEFVKWFKSLPGATLHPDVKLEDLRARGAGRGLVATADLPAESELFTIPRKSLICTDNSSLREKLPSVFENDDAENQNDADESMEGAAVEGITESADNWLHLILVLMHEYLQGNASRWKPYLDVLPNRFDTLMFWTPDELSELQASAVKKKVGREEADIMFGTKVLPVIKRHEDVFYSPDVEKLDDEKLIRLAHRMGSIIMAYAFDLEKDQDEDEDAEEDGWIQDKEGQTLMGMVPMADMLNADAEFNAHLNHGEDSLTMTSLRTIKAGEEILNYYGPLPTSDLVRRYGYTTPKHARYDVVEIEWTLIILSICQCLDKSMEEFTAAVAKDFDLDDIAESYVIERVSEGPDDSGRLTGDTSPDVQLEMEPLVKQLLSFLVDCGTISKLKDKMKTLHFNEVYAVVMQKVLTAKFGQYQTTAEHDRALLASPKIHGRYRMAIEIRLGEKRLLEDSRTMISRQLYEIKAKLKQDASSEPPSKKRKTGK